MDSGAPQSSSRSLQMKCASFFAGVGGIDIGFEQAGFETVYANEFDPYAPDTL